MYFAMDEIGFENAEKIKTESDKWRFIYNVAKNYGFEGIHITPSLYKKFDLDIDNIPEYFSDFKLTFHVSEKDLEKSLELAVKHNMYDVSIHPPPSSSPTEKNLSVELFKKSVDKWLNKFLKRGISFSLETHVAGEYFLFDGLYEFVNFIDLFPELGVLIDISHNYYNPQYSEDDIINILGNKNVKGLHISDALRSAEFEKGTHLPIGDGTIDFTKLLKHFDKIENLYGVLEIKSNNEGIERSLKNLKKEL